MNNPHSLQAIRDNIRTEAASTSKKEIIRMSRNTGISTSCTDYWEDNIKIDLREVGWGAWTGSI
jgi:hypothetical protein